VRIAASFPSWVRASKKLSGKADIFKINVEKGRSLTLHPPIDDHGLPEGTKKETRRTTTLAQQAKPINGGFCDVLLRTKEVVIVVLTHVFRQRFEFELIGNKVRRVYLFTGRYSFPGSEKSETRGLS
jgi:hypothetical protein